MKNFNWLVGSFIDRSTQDDKKSKFHAIAAFENPITPEDFLLPNLPNPEIPRYIVHVENEKAFEQFYNHYQDCKAAFGDKWIYHINDIDLNTDKINLFRNLLHI